MTRRSWLSALAARAAVPRASSFWSLPLALALACGGPIDAGDGGSIEDAGAIDGGRAIDGGNPDAGRDLDGGITPMLDGGITPMVDGGITPLVDSGPPVIDAGGPPRCASDSECNDSLYCNGVEGCAPGAPGADAFGCTRGTPPCAGAGTCDEDTDLCSPCSIDDDGDDDGYPALECGGTDCADTRADIHPDAIETCDTEDDDCDLVIDDGLPVITYYIDMDHDGWGGPFIAMLCEADRPGLTLGTGDCMDFDPFIHPGAVEVPGDGRDNDCNGRIDELPRRIRGGIEALGGVTQRTTRRIVDSRFERLVWACAASRCVEGSLVP